MHIGNDAVFDDSITVQGSTTLNSGLGVTGDVNVQGGVTSSAPMNAPAFHQTSDYRAKSNVLPIEDGLCVIMRLQPKIYEMKDGFEAPVRLASGLIAHEVQEVINHPVSGHKDGRELQRVDYSQFIAYLIRAVQQQQEKIQELESKLNGAN